MRKTFWTGEETGRHIFTMLGQQPATFSNQNVLNLQLNVIARSFEDAVAAFRAKYPGAMLFVAQCAGAIALEVAYEDDEGVKQPPQFNVVQLPR